MIFLTDRQIVTINRLTIQYHGGFFVPPCNLRNPSALSYLVEAVQSEVFGQQLYPSIFDKAGVYMFNIIDNHIFLDGAKRTGLEAGLLFLKLNGYQLNETVTNDILTKFIFSIAEGGQTLESVQEWLKNHSVKNYKYLEKIETALSIVRLNLGSLIKTNKEYAEIIIRDFKIECTEQDIDFLLKSSG